MRGTSLLIGCLVACTADGPPAWEGGISCELTKTLVESSPGIEIDLVFVVSDAPSMAPYRDALIANLRASASSLQLLQGSPGLRVAVVDATGQLTADPRMPGCTGPDQTPLVDLQLPWFWCADDALEGCRFQNYDGMLGDALPCIGAIAADGSAATPLLERLESALGDGALARDGALLAVVFIGVDDDASSGDPGAYADRLLAHHREWILVGAVTGPDTPRLDAFLARFEGLSTHASIDDGDWSDVLQFDPGWGGIVNGCLRADRLLDTNADRPGLQPNCVAAERGDGAAIPACRMLTPVRPDPTTPLPCYWLDPSMEEDPECTYVATVERLNREPLAELRCECAP